MERFDDNLDMVELGTASEETRGDGVVPPEIGGKLPAISGIASDD